MSHTMSTSLPHILHPLGSSFVLYSPSHDTHLMRQSLLSAISISLLSSLTIVVSNRCQQSLPTIVTHNYFTFLFLCRIFRSTRCLLNKVFAPLGVFILLYVLRGFFVRASYDPIHASHLSFCCSGCVSTLGRLGVFHPRPAVLVWPTHFHPAPRRLAPPSDSSV